MKKSENIKALSPQLPGRGGEGGSTIPDRDGTNTNILSREQEKQYHHILRATLRAGVYGEMAGDVAVEAWLKARERGYFIPIMLSEAARNLGIWKITHEAELREDIADYHWDDEIQRKKQRERIEEAIASGSPPVQKACRLVLDEGFDLGEAAKVFGLSSATFSRELSFLGRRKSKRKNRDIRDSKTYVILRGEKYQIDNSSRPPL
ncbi:MAG: hypothetical protein ABSB95_08085 [Dissulfurispiraceae bacterium]|jgi:DNA-directed RNA polymerase specialized sigma24 family protein